jgi:hypothetical protein
VEAAHWFRAEFAARIKQCADMSPMSVTNHLTGVAKWTPAAISMADCGSDWDASWSFSVAIAIVHGDQLFVLAAGIFGAFHHSARRGAAMLHRPRTLAGDDRIMLTALGPYPLEIGDCVLLARRELLDLAQTSLLNWPDLDALTLHKRAVTLGCRPNALAIVTLNQETGDQRQGVPST